MSLLLACVTMPVTAMANPPCVAPDASNFVLGSLTTETSGPWLLQSVNSSKRFVMRRCSANKKSECYFATDVEPGRYYFRELLMGVNNSLDYPVSKPALWIEVTGQGIDYIGNWIIDRGDRRVINNLQVTYTLDTLDEMIALCQIAGKRLFLDQTRTKPLEIVD
ncbi:hypothetical protein [Dokdonella sp.]|uniref:hypothetical protein n=1 Tax=Dokdonella sp. TaxID=2291710 RepID=UPI003528BF8A